MIIIILSAVILLLVCLLVFMYFNHIKTLTKLDSMLDAAIANRFCETEFSETELSKIEAKMFRYLSAGKTSLTQIETEKNMIKSLISDISHQTKTPISNILLYSQLLTESNSLSENEAALANRIEEQTEKLNFLIGALIKISRLENGIVAVLPKRNSVKKLLSAIDFGNCAVIKNIDLTIENDMDLIAFFDFKWTLETISNIVDNAIKYTPYGGRVRISAADYEMFVKIDVEDNGIGISEQDFPKIFARFYRSQKVSDCQGVGVGLYLAREIVSKQGGYIKVASKENEGSVFSVFIPKSENMSKV